MPYPEVGPLSRRDYAGIMEIEMKSFLSHWDRHQIDAICRVKDHIGMVAKVNDTQVGYMVYRLGRTNIEIIRFVVHPRYRGKGVGWTMMTKLKSRLTPGKRSRLTAILSEWDDKGHAWLKRRAFLATSVIHAEKSDYYEFEYFLNEDAVEYDKNKLAGIPQ